MEILVGMILFVIGLCFGSFVNMLVYRTAVKYGVLKLKRADTGVRPYNKNRSFCDYCGKQLKWYENVPVFSWIILGGKTKCCHKKLPLAYPIVELIMGILFVFYGIKFSVYENNIIFWIWGLLILVFLVFSTLFDWKYMILPDFSTIILILATILLMLGGHGGPPLQNLFVALIAAGFLLVLNLVTKGKGMGMGDVKYALFMGLFLGYQKTIVAFYVAFVVGAIWGIILMILKKVKRKTQVPFGPFLIFGTIVAWWWGEWILNLVFSSL